MRRSFLQRHSLVLVVYGMILVLMFIGAMNSERFLSLRNLTNVLRQAAYLGTAALGEMLVILTAELIFRLARWSNFVSWSQPFLWTEIRIMSGWQ